MGEVDDRAPFLQHLEELRKRLIISICGVAVGFAVAYAFIQDIFNFLVKPLRSVMPADSAIVMIKMTEGFLTYLKLAIYTGILAASPLIFFQVWSFISPGLYKKEKRTILPLVIISSILFAVGVIFTYTVVLPVGLKFLLEYVGGSVQATLSMASYVSFSCLFMVLFGVVFQLPLVMMVLSRLGLVQSSSLAKNRKYVMLVCVLVGALLTPPDIFSQLLMAIPVFILFEISIWLVRFSETMRKKKAADPEDAVS